MKINRELSGRELLTISKKYGAKAALFATASMATMGFVPPLADFVISDAKAAKKAKYNLRYGATVISKGNEPRFQTKAYRFVELVEKMTDGEVHIQTIDGRFGLAHDGLVSPLPVTCADIHRRSIIMSYISFRPLLDRISQAVQKILHGPQGSSFPALKQIHY